MSFDEMCSWYAQMGTGLTMPQLVEHWGNLKAADGNEAAPKQTFDRRVTPLAPGERVLAVFFGDLHEEELAYAGLACTVHQLLMEPPKQLFPPQLPCMRAWLGLPPDAPVWPRNLEFRSAAATDPAVQAGRAAFKASMQTAQSRPDSPPARPGVSFGSMADDVWEDLLLQLEELLGIPLTTQQRCVLRNLQGLITEWRQTAGSAKSTLLLSALKLAVSAEPGGIGLFLTKSHDMAKDAYVLAQRLFGESGVLLLDVE